MAQLRPRTRASSENVQVDRPGKSSRPAVDEPAAKRRALGDISNALGPSNNTRGQASKGKAQQHQQQGPREQPAPQRQEAAPESQQQQQQQQRVQQRSQQRQQPTTRGRPPTRQSQRRSSAANTQPPDAAADKQPQSRVTRSRAKSAQRADSLQQSSQLAAAAGSVASAPTPAHPPLPDIDEIDRDNPLAATTYVNDLYNYYRRVEPRFQVPSNYMEQQEDITIKMRNILVDWLVDVHFKFKLMPETLFLTVNLIDRYLNLVLVGRHNLQLVGATAMLIASKYEEVWSPEVKDFVYVSDKAYTREDILDMEKDMLKKLDYSLTLATSYQYLARLLKAAEVQYNKELCLFVAYCAELCLVDYRMLRWSYSEQAAGIMYVALSAFSVADPYPYTMQRHACESRQTAVAVAREVVALLRDAPASPLQAVCKKYSTEKFCAVAKIAPPLSILSE